MSVGIYYIPTVIVYCDKVTIDLLKNINIKVSTVYGAGAGAVFAPKHKGGTANQCFCMAGK